MSLKVKSNGINFNVPTIENLPTERLEEGLVCVVTDENRGGVFVYREANALVNNGGTIFNGWTRQYSGAVNIKWFGAKGDGVTDDTVAIQSAINHASVIFIPQGNFIISGITSHANGKTIFGLGVDTSVLLSTITDGGIAFKASGENCIFHDFKVRSSTGSKANFKPMEFGSQVDGTSCTRSSIRVKVANGTTGVSMRGWINTTNVLSVFCDVGFYAREFNSCIADIKVEGCLKGCDIEECYGTTINNLLIENAFSAGTTTYTSTFDNFEGLTISNIYLEGGSFSTTALAFGTLASSKALNISNISSTITPEDRTDSIVIDNVNGVTVLGNIAKGGYHGSISFTSNCNGINPLLLTYPSTLTGSNQTPSLQDNSKKIRKAQNFAGDTYLDAGFNTFDVITKSGVTTSIETSNIITGKQGIRIEAATGGTTRYLSLRRTVNIFPFVANLVGKTIKMFAWVYVPDLPKFKDRTYKPAIEISVSGGASAYSASQQTLKHGIWNLVETTQITVPAGWTGISTDKIDITFFVNSTATSVSDPGYYIIVDSIFITDGSVSMLDIMRGNVENYNMFGIDTDANNMTLKSMNYSALAVAEHYHRLGDKILYTTPTAGGFLGRVCTTAGAGGLSSWKTFGAITA